MAISNRNSIPVPRLFYELLLPFLLILLVIHLLWNKFKPGLLKIPGPPIAAYTRLWRLINIWKGNAHLTAIELHKKYGPLVRVGPKHISVGDPREISNIYTIKGDFTKTAFYPIQSIVWQKVEQRNLFSCTDEQYHRNLRRPAANAFAATSLLSKEEAIDFCTGMLIERLHEHASANKPIDLGVWLQYYAFDVVGELCFSERLGFLEKGKDVDGMISTIEGILVYSTYTGQIPESHNFLLGNPLLPKLLPMMENWNQVVQFTLKAMNKSSKHTRLAKDGEFDRTEMEARGDMMSRWSAADMNARDLVVNLSANVFAGSDTTAIAFRAIIYFLLRNPEKLQKLLKEIGDADRAGKLSQPIQYKESLNCLPYLDAVIKEGTRLHPSVGLLLERHVPSNGAQICGRHIPAGTVVGINAWVVHRDPAVFPKPDKFEPERWINSPEEHLKEMNRAYFAFGAGSRTCIGKYIALIEMAKLIPQLFREFDITLTYPERDMKVRGLWFAQNEGLICNISKRSIAVST